MGHAGALQEHQAGRGVHVMILVSLAHAPHPERVAILALGLDHQRHVIVSRELPGPVHLLEVPQPARDTAAPRLRHAAFHGEQDMAVTVCHRGQQSAVVR